MIYNWQTITKKNDVIRQLQAVMIVQDNRSKTTDVIGPMQREIICGRGLMKQTISLDRSKQPDPFH